MSYCNRYVVDLNQLKLNCKLLKNYTQKKICAVVKANAYGVGLKCFSETIVEYVDYFAVACFCEAYELRGYLEISKPILILGIVSSNDIVWCAKNNICVNISSFSLLKKYVKILVNEVEKLKIHIKINTGLNRYGVSSESELKKIIQYSEKFKDKVCIDGIFTHFATKSKDLEFMNVQCNIFQKYTKFVKNKCINIHICNSYSSINNEEVMNKYDMIRVGWALHGNIKNNMGIKPILSIYSQILFIHKVKKGESIGYDRSFTATRNMKIAVVGIGYADGLDRKLSGRFSLLVNNVFCPIVGLICMDCCMIDIASVKNVRIGDSVTILGSDANKSISIENYSVALECSPYEIQLAFNYKRMKYIELSNNSDMLIYE